MTNPVVVFAEDQLEQLAVKVAEKVLADLDPKLESLLEGKADSLGADVLAWIESHLHI